MSNHNDDLPEIPDPLYDIGVSKAPKPAPERASAPPQAAPATAQEAAEDDYSGSDAVDIPDPLQAYAPPPPKDNPHKDKFEGAVQMAFIGAGQGGGRIADAFYNFGYRRVAAVNTTVQDLKGLKMPEDRKLVIGNNRGGAGKDPTQGEAAARESYEDIMDHLMRCWGEGAEHLYVCVGGGGGSGTGSWPVLLEALRDYAQSTNIEKPFYKHLGVILTLPKRSEGSRVQRNALAAVQTALEKLENKEISSLILVDNSKIHELYPGLPVKMFWKVANDTFCGVFHTFNLLAAKDSDYNCLDAETEALTQRGWVRGFDLDPKDVLLTKNAESGELEWQGMTDLKLFPEYKGQLYEIETRTLSAVTTPNHRWLVTDYQGEDVCKVTEELSTSGHDRIHRGGTYRGPSTSPWTDDFVELMGWFLTDGTKLVTPRVREPSQPRVSVKLYQSQRANPEKVARIDALLARLGCLAHRSLYEPDQRVSWRIDRSTSEILHSLFPDRVLTPEVASSLTATQAHRLMKAMLLGDGNAASADNRQQVFSARSQEAIDAFQMLSMLVGKASTSRWRDMSGYEPQSDKLSNAPNMTGVFTSTVLRRQTAQLQKEHVTIRGAREGEGVWCPIVPNTYFVARRKGTVYVTGNTFDRADYRSVVQNGLMIFGRTKVSQWRGKEDISQAVRQNLAGSLLAEGFDLSKADMAGAIVVAHDDVLGEIPMENIDYAFNSLGRVLGNDGITLHSGIYEGRQPGMQVLTIVSGLEPPASRMQELEDKSK